MKQKHEGKDLQSLVDLGREQGYLTFDQVNGLLPQDVTSPTELRSALESFEDMDIKVLDDVPADGTGGELEAEVKQEPDEAADSIGESSDPVRLYLKEMGNFQLLSRGQERSPQQVCKRDQAARRLCAYWRIVRKARVCAGSRALVEQEKVPKRRFVPESGKSYPVAISVVPSADRPAMVPRTRNPRIAN